MTVFFPDLSNWEPNLEIQPGTVAVVAKATEGTYYRDASFFRFKDGAGRTGALFSGYHFLMQNIDPTAQADFYHAFAGDVPCMLDVETEGTSRPTVDQCVLFIERLRTLGGRCWGVYFPRWYWQQVGGDLGALERSGACLVSSSYMTYSTTGAGWAGYGGATPKVWQYTSSQQYGGAPCDFNAFEGTLDDLQNLIYGDTMIPYDVWAFKNPQLDANTDMRQRLVNAETNAEAANAKLDQVLEKLAALTVGSVDVAALAKAEVDELKARL